MPADLLLYFACISREMRVCNQRMALAAYASHSIVKPISCKKASGLFGCRHSLDLNAKSEGKIPPPRLYPFGCDMSYRTLDARAPENSLLSYVQEYYLTRFDAYLCEKRPVAYTGWHARSYNSSAWSVGRESQIWTPPFLSACCRIRWLARTRRL